MTITIILYCVLDEWKQERLSLSDQTELAQWINCCTSTSLFILFSLYSALLLLHLFVKSAASKLQTSCRYIQFTLPFSSTACHYILQFVDNILHLYHFISHKNPFYLKLIIHFYLIAWIDPSISSLLIQKFILYSILLIMELFKNLKTLVILIKGMQRKFYVVNLNSSR